MLTLVQLNAALTSDQIGQIRSRSLVEVSQGQPSPDPVAEEIAAAIGKVTDSTTGWLLSPATLTGYARDIAAAQLAKRLGTPTADQVRAYDTALKELEQIRKGDWPNLQPDPDAVAAAAPRIRHGSRTKIETSKT